MKECAVSFWKGPDRAARDECAEFEGAVDIREKWFGLMFAIFKIEQSREPPGRADASEEFCGAEVGGNAGRDEQTDDPIAADQPHRAFDEQRIDVYVAARK